MIFAGDLWIQYPVKDMYDKQIMAMSILAARDMYEKGQLEIKDFRDKYGSFLTPIQKDQDWYNENVTGGAQNLINNLYELGIDPVRSEEGRAAISQFVNTLPVGDIAKLKESANAAKEYQKNRAILQAKGLWNPELERQIMGGNTMEDWDTLGGGLVFTRTSPAEYQDLNQYTSHIFDALKDSYIGTKDGYDYYGVTPQHMYQSLTPDTLGGLVNSDLGRFHYNNAKNDLITKGITNPTEAQIMQQFRDNIVAANHEKVRSDRRMNEMYKLNREHASRISAARYRQLTNQTPQYSFAEVVRRGTPTAILGRAIETYDLGTPQLLKALLDEQGRFGKEVSKITGKHSNTQQGFDLFKQKYGQNQYNERYVAEYLESRGFQHYNDAPLEFILPKSQYKKLFNDASVVTHTAGFRGKKAFTPRQDLYNASYVTVTVTSGSYQAFMKDARNKAHFNFVVKERDANGKVTGTKNMYWDSDITSVQNDQRLGQLDPKINVGIVDTQDTRFQNAIMADKDVTKDLISGTAYNFDEILSEMIGYGR